MKKNNNVEINRINPDIDCEKCEEQLKFSDNLCGTWIDKKFTIDIICPKCKSSFDREMMISTQPYGNKAEAIAIGWKTFNGNTYLGAKATGNTMVTATNDVEYDYIVNETPDEGHGAEEIDLHANEPLAVGEAPPPNFGKTWNPFKNKKTKIPNPDEEW